MTPPAPDSVAIDVLGLVSREYGCNTVLEGSGSLVSDSEIPDELPAYDGDAAALYTHFLPDHITQQPSPPHYWLAVVDSRGRVRWTEKHADWDVLVLVARSTPADYLAYLRREQVCYLVAGEERVDLTQALVSLGTELGTPSIMD
jgi:hypothetical protein